MKKINIFQAMLNALKPKSKINDCRLTFIQFVKFLQYEYFRSLSMAKLLMELGKEVHKLEVQVNKLNSHIHYIEIKDIKNALNISKEQINDLPKKQKSRRQRPKNTQRKKRIR